jgi:hypothetical protein
MARKTMPEFTPDPEYEAAYCRAIDTADICAATLFGEKLVEDPARQASPRALMMAMGMIYFLLRLDPADLRALGAQDGFGDLCWKPFPPDYVVRRNGPFADLLTTPRQALEDIRQTGEQASPAA